MRPAIVAILAVTFALVGPRLFGESSKARDAGEPFAYLPPEGFREDPEKAKDGARVFVHPDSEQGIPAIVAVHHTDKSLTFADGELARLVQDMPKAFEDANCTWVHRRHEVRTRPDGARVGLIEGDCDRDVDMTGFGFEKGTLKTRKLQLLFPEDRGLAIATASYATTEAARWEPAFEATIATAKGVASRYPPPPPWQYAMWAAAGAVLGWLGLAIVARGRRKPA